MENSLNRRTFLIAGGVSAGAIAAASYAGFRSLGSMQDYNAAMAEQRAVLKENPQTEELLRLATLAANSHNTQPWQFKLNNDGLDILPDFTRHLSAVDPDNHHLFASLGCAAENLSIASARSGKTGNVAFDPTGDGKVNFKFSNGAQKNDALYDSIPLRQSTRNIFDGRTVPTEQLALLQLAAAIKGVDLVLLTARREMDNVRDLVVAANSVQMADKAFVTELKTWMRFNPRQALKAGDGLFSATTGNPVLPTWLGPSLFDFVFNAKTENAKYIDQIASSAGIAIFVSQKDDAEHWMLAGRACQRFALQATALGLKHAFINQPVEVAKFRPELAALAGLPGRRPDIVMRFGYGTALPNSARRPVKNVLV